MGIFKNFTDKTNRRKFFKSSVVTIAVGTFGLGFGSKFVLRRKKLLLRPPGALDEDLFLASCIKCGQCLQVCPPKAINLAGFDQGFGFGTPYITAREQACVLCKGLPCVLACPTGSLNHDLSEGKDADMGLAVLRSPKTCLAVKKENDLVYTFNQIALGFSGQGPILKKIKLTKTIKELVSRFTDAEKQLLISSFGLGTKSDGEKLALEIAGKIKTSKDVNTLAESAKQAQQSQTTCRICLEKCPIKDEKPIIFKEDSASTGSFRPHIQNSCVGCGVCEMECPVEDPCIVITPQFEKGSVV
ncbi:MAG: 4Fe-4S dicluster domain-containing protein [Bacteriovoracaceae bacterium]|jgi:ferredoxin-type protein NapG|nr:4Fe-4S dicluster domain-containing protein [Bacteriovoracaceae bacterium]